MYSNEDLSSVYTFMKQTGEGNLRKMWVDAKFTPTHFNMLMKVMRAGPETQFIECAQKGTFPRLKFSAQEVAIRENFWSDVFVMLKGAGLLNEMAAAA